MKRGDSQIAKCRNTKCEHNRKGGGCRLFEGLNFLRCRQCVTDAAKRKGE